MRKAAVIAKAAALSLLALTLSGCFTSEDELVGYWAADRPIETGVWAHWPTHPDGTEWDRETWRGEIDLDRRRYRSDEENFPHEGARLKRLSGDIYLAQIPREGGVGYGVAWVYEDGACDQLSPARLRRTDRGCAGHLHARPRPGRLLHRDDLDQVEAVMGAYLDAVGEDIIVDGVYRRVE
jgi:hypothetical protein